MRLLKTEPVAGFTRYLVDWDGMVVWLDLGPDGVLDSTFTKGSESELALLAFIQDKVYRNSLPERLGGKA